LKSAEKSSLSANVAEILRVIEQKPRCVRSDLAAAILQSKPEADLPGLKAALAGDLRWLIQAGHVIEFHDGTLDVPPTPRPEAAPGSAATAKPATPAEAAEDAEPASDALVPAAEGGATFDGGPVAEDIPASPVTLEANLEIGAPGEGTTSPAVTAEGTTTVDGAT
jgi:hypothetical protein